MSERDDPPYVAAEAEMLAAWLDYHRATLEMKCAGLTPAQLRARSAEPSTMSLHGLVRHMADVERHWFRRILGRAPDTPNLFWSAENPDADFDGVDDADLAADLAAWRAEIDEARRIAASLDLDDLYEHPRAGTMSARWVLTHMVEEYARHNGHADLLRERIDGVTGE